MSKSFTSSDFLDGMPPTPIPPEQRSPFGPKSAAESPNAELKATAQASDAGPEATDKASDKIEAAKASGADTVASLARTAASAADSLEEKSPLAAKYVRSAAEGAERLSQNLRDWKVSHVGSSLGEFAKSQPVAVAGLGMIAGYIVGRFIGASDRSA
jgi:hypothetical protein